MFNQAGLETFTPIYHLMSSLAASIAIVGVFIFPVSNLASNIDATHVSLELRLQWQVKDTTSSLVAKSNHNLTRHVSTKID